MTNEKEEHLTIVARLQRAEDMLSILQLFNQYGQYLDQGHFDKYAALFSEDGEVKLGALGRASGPQAIEELMTRKLGDAVGQSYHIISNPVVELDGDTARAQVMWTVILQDKNGKPYIGMAGHHRDELIRHEDGWRFRLRSGHIDIPREYKSP